MEIKLKVPKRENRDALKNLCNAVDRSYLSDRLPDPYTDASADWWINMVTENEEKAGLWRLIEVDGEIVGNISVEKGEGMSRRDANIGYILLTPYWGKGIMTWAAAEICRLAFEKLDIVRITGVYYEPNRASGRVLEKVGFQPEGKKINAVTKRDATYNLCMLGLLKEQPSRHLF